MAMVRTAISGVFGGLAVLSNFVQTWTTLKRVDQLLKARGLEIEVKMSGGPKGRTAFRLIPRESP